METVEFKPDQKGIEERQKIVPSGRAADYTTQKPVEIKFNVMQSDAGAAVDISLVQASQAASEAYTPPTTIRERIVSHETEFTVRVTNIPQHLSHRDLSLLFIKAWGSDYNRVKLVTDQETRESKGVAYVSFNSKDKAAEFARAVRNIVVDSFKFAVEILQR